MRNARADSRKRLFAIRFPSVWLRYWRFYTRVNSLQAFHTPGDAILLPSPVI